MLEYTNYLNSDGAQRWRSDGTSYWYILHGQKVMHDFDDCREFLAKMTFFVKMVGQDIVQPPRGYISYHSLKLDGEQSPENIKY